ncbi:hypothetical protein Tco_0436692 [Tanacetum coccineum]
MFINSQFTLDYDSQMTDNYFVEYIGIEVKHFKDTLLQHMGNVKKSVAERTRNDTNVDDADIRPIYDEEPLAEGPRLISSRIFTYPIRRIGLLWIRRIELVSFVFFGECRHGYAVSSLMDTAYWSSE